MTDQQPTYDELQAVLDQIWGAIFTPFLTHTNAEKLALIVECMQPLGYQIPIFDIQTEAENFANEDE